MQRPTAPDSVTGYEFLSVTGESIHVPDAQRLVHLQFRRFAGCPICNLHLQSFAARHDEISAAGVREVVFFHSAPSELIKHTANLPFPTVGDPDKRWYREFGVEAGARALLNPRAWPAILRGGAMTVRGRFRAPSTKPAGGRLGLPADFLIGRDGAVLAAKYGTHADDQWSVDDLLTLAATARI